VRFSCAAEALINIKKIISCRLGLKSLDSKNGNEVMELCDRSAGQRCDNFDDLLTLVTLLFPQKPFDERWCSPFQKINSQC
jgi:hypothetical protein